jgi:hypothetical protein
MDNRPTRQFTTPSGHAVVIYDYMTGLEVETIRNFYASKTEIKSISQQGDKVEAGISGMSADAALETKKLAMRTTLVSIDGATDDLDAVALNMPNEDYQQILNEVNDLIEGKKNS